MRSERGKTVEEPAVIMSPETASGAYIAIGSSTTVAVGSTTTGASVAVGSAGAVVGATVAGVPQAASKRLMATTINNNERTVLDISFSPLGFIQR
jgi:hypothetical protein